LQVDLDRRAPSEAWLRQRARLRRWLDDLPEERWDEPTRCEGWDVTKLVRHLASASQFLGYTLHKATNGVATTLLEGFDPQRVPQQAAAALGNLTPTGARQALVAMDSSVAVELRAMGELAWSVKAESPLGHLAAHLVVSHFLWDSWVHERDFLEPRHEVAIRTPEEVEIVVMYLLGMATVATASTTAIDLRLTDPALRVGVGVVDGEARVGVAPKGAAVIEARTVDFVDRATGRKAGPVGGDQQALGVMDEFAVVLSG